MNNFTSTCSQVVSNSTCTTGGALDPSAYNGAIPLIKVNTEYCFLSFCNLFFILVTGKSQLYVFHIFLILIRTSDILYSCCDTHQC